MVASGTSLLIVWNIILADSSHSATQRQLKIGSPSPDCPSAYPLMSVRSCWLVLKVPVSIGIDTIC